MGIEQHLDNVFSDAARKREKYWKGKKAEYRITENFSKQSAKGVCRVTSVYYDKSADCDIYRIEDIDTGKVYQVDQFNISLKEVES